MTNDDIEEEFHELGIFLSERMDRLEAKLDELIEVANVGAMESTLEEIRDLLKARVL